MFSYIQNLFRKYKDIAAYIVFGFLTTVINYLVYIPLYNILHISAVFSNVIAWFAAVIFAYLTNKPFVFKSNDWSRKVVVPEFIKFIGCRVSSGAIESLVIFFAVDIFRGNGNIWKIITGVIVIIYNYFGSKLFVFRKK